MSIVAGRRAHGFGACVRPLPRASSASQAAFNPSSRRNRSPIVAARRRVADYYDKAFGAHPKITTPFRAAYSNHVFHQYTLILENTDRDGLNEFLATQRIPSMIYYPVPAHRQQMFAASGGGNYHLPTTDWLTERVISLPMHTELDDDQLQTISAAVLEYVNKN